MKKQPLKRLQNKEKPPTRTALSVDAWMSAQAEATCGRGLAFIIDKHEAEAAELMKPMEGSTEIMLGEAVPLPAVFPEDEDDYDYADDLAISTIRDTLLQEPDTVALDASMARLKIAHDAECLEIAIDTSHSIQARNSLEKMLSHQMAVLHTKSMDCMTKARNFPKGREDLEIKMLNVACRLMDTYQKGMETITRTRNAGRQTITVVKQTNVNGGQNVITDNFTGQGGR